MAKEITVPTSGAIVSYQVITEDYNNWKVDNVSGVTVKYHDETTTESISGSGQDNFKIVFPKLESTVEKPYLQETVDFPMNVEITSGICEGVSEEVTFKQQPYYTLTFNGIPNSEYYRLEIYEILSTQRLNGEYKRQLGCSGGTKILNVYNDDTSEISGLKYNEESPFSGNVFPGYPLTSDFDFIISGTTNEICKSWFVFCDIDGDGVIYPICEFVKSPNSNSAYTISSITQEINHLLTTTNEEPLSIVDEQGVLNNSTISSAIANGYLIACGGGYCLSTTAQDHDFIISGQTSNYVSPTDYKILIHIV